MPIRPLPFVLLAALAGAGCSFSRKEGSPTDAPPSGPAATGEAFTGGTEPLGEASTSAKLGETKPEPKAESTRDGSPQTPENKFVPAKVFKELPAEGQELLRQIRELDKAVPVVFFGLKRPADQILKDVETAIELSRRFTTDHPSTEPVCEVNAVLVRMELARLPRYRDSLTAQGLSPQAVAEAYGAHSREILTLAEANAAECPRGSTARKTSLVVIMYMHDRLEEYDKLRSTADLILKEYPEYDGRPNLHVTVGQSYFSERRYPDMVKYLREVIRVHSEDPEYVLYNDRLFDALNGAGDLEGMEELMHLIRAEYQIRIPTLEEGHYLRAQYEQWLCVSLFWIGYVRMALGDNEGARSAFKQHIAEGEARDEKAAAEGRQLGQDVCHITIEFRTKDLLGFLDEFYGKAPRVDLDLQEMWATQEKLTLREAKGKVVALVFRMPENRRAETFLQAIDALVKQHREELAGVALGYTAGKPNPTEDELLLQKMRDDLKRMGVSLPAGFDPDRKSQQIIREVHGIVGTPSFVLLNKKGELAWYMADPRDMDREIVKRVIERLLAEGKKQ